MGKGMRIVFHSAGFDVGGLLRFTEGAILDVFLSMTKKYLVAPYSTGVGDLAKRITNFKVPGSQF